jgi:hypothetical protein
MIKLIATQDWDRLGDLIAKGKDPDKKSPGGDTSGTKSPHRSKEGGSGHSKANKSSKPSKSSILNKSSKSDGSDASTPPSEVATAAAKEEEGPQSIELA